MPNLIPSPSRTLGLSLDDIVSASLVGSIDWPR
jgi:hypothetical protein